MKISVGRSKNKVCCLHGACGRSQDDDDCCLEITRMVQRERERERERESNGGSEEEKRRRRMRENETRIESGHVESVYLYGWV
jgi:hypothetical protein